MKMKELKNHKNYFITKTGQVFSKAKRHNHPLKLRELSKFNKNGYYAIAINNKKYYVHRLVLETYFKECPKGMECLHINGKRTDNRLNNLRWGTRIENQADRKKHGTDNTGIRHPQHKLTPMDVKKIRELVKTMFHKDVAKLFSIHKSTVSGVVTRRSWSSVI